MNSPAGTGVGWFLIGILILCTGVSAGAETDMVPEISVKLHGDITNTFLEPCIADRIRGWRLPEFTDGEPITVTFVLAVPVGS